MEGVCLGLLVLLGAFQSVSSQETTVSIQGRDLLVNGVKFNGRGACYGTCPFGQWPDSKQGSGIWDWQSSPPVYNRDIPLLQEMNANLIRTYQWRYGVRHDAFLDACYAAGVYVLVGYQWDWDDFASNQQQMRNDVIAMVQNHADHPAVLGWLIGNELNLGRGYQSNVWAFVKDLSDLVHATEAPRWHPVGSPLADGQSMWDTIDARDGDMDMWMVQLYRGQTFYDFWTTYAGKSGKPLMITEYGVDSYINGQSSLYGEQMQAQWDVTMWEEIQANSNLLSGALLFQWSDGFYKCGGSFGGGISAQDTCSSPRGDAFPGGDVNEEFFGLFAIVNTQVAVDGGDTFRPKEAYCRFKQSWQALPRAPHASSYVPTNISGCPSYAQSAKVFPSEDAFVRGGDFAAQNFGDEAILLVKYAATDSFAREAYLKFDLTPYVDQAPFGSGLLVMKVQNIDRNELFPISVGLVTDDNWSESTITWNTKKDSTLIGVVERGVGDVTITMDLLQQINQAAASDGVLSLRLYRPGGADTNLALHSKEAVEIQRPALELSATPITPPTSQGTGQTTQQTASTDGSTLAESSAGSVAMSLLTTLAITVLVIGF